MAAVEEAARIQARTGPTSCGGGPTAVRASVGEGRDRSGGGRVPGDTTTAEEPARGVGDLGGGPGDLDLRTGRQPDADVAGEVGSVEGRGEFTGGRVGW